MKAKMEATDLPLWQRLENLPKAALLGRPAFVRQKRRSPFPLQEQWLISLCLKNLLISNLHMTSSPLIFVMPFPSRLTGLLLCDTCSPSRHLYIIIKSSIDLFSARHFLQSLNNFHVSSLHPIQFFSILGTRYLSDRHEVRTLRGQDIIVWYLLAKAYFFQCWPRYLFCSWMTTYNIWGPLWGTKKMMQPYLPIFPTVFRQRVWLCGDARNRSSSTGECVIWKLGYVHHMSLSTWHHLLDVSTISLVLMTADGLPVAIMEMYKQMST